MRKRFIFFVLATVSSIFFSNLTIAAETVEKEGATSEQSFIESLFTPRTLNQGCHTYPDCPPAEELQIQLETQAVYNASDETDDQE